MKSLNKLKTILAVSALAVSLSACQSTQEDYSMHNHSVEAQLQPVDEFITGYVFDMCDTELTLDNYDQVMTEAKSDVYGNPFAGDCVPISFNLEEESFTSRLLAANSNNDELKPDILTGVDKAFAVAGKKVTAGKIIKRDSRFVSKYVLSNGEVAQAMKFAESGFTESAKKQDRAYDTLISVYDEFFFLHEIFHMTTLNYDASLPQSVKESYSDIAAIIAISNAKVWSTDKMKDLMSNVYASRERGSRNAMTSWVGSTHRNPTMLRAFERYVDTASEQEMTTLRGLDSLPDIAKWVESNIVNIDNDKRETLMIGKVYWRP